MEAVRLLAVPLKSGLLCEEITVVLDPPIVECCTIFLESWNDDVSALPSVGFFGFAILCFTYCTMLMNAHTRFGGKEGLGTMERVHTPMTASNSKLADLHTHMRLMDAHTRSGLKDGVRQDGPSPYSCGRIGRRPDSLLQFLLIGSRVATGGAAP